MNWPDGAEEPLAKLCDHLNKKLREQHESDAAKDIAQQIETNSLRAPELRMQHPVKPIGSRRTATFKTSGKHGHID